MGPPDTNEIHLFHHTLKRTGGKERYAIALAQAFRRLDHPVTFHALAGDSKLAAELDIRLNVISPRFPRKLLPLYFFRATDTLRRKLPGIHISLSRVRVKDVLISGGTHLAYLERGRKFKGPFDYLQVWMERASYAAASHIVAHSDLIASELAGKYSVQKEKLTTLYAPVDDRFQKPNPTRSRDETRKRLGWPPDKVVFLFPSSGHSRKGLRPISEAMAPFANQVVLAVAGKPAGGQRYPFLISMDYVEDMVAAYSAADFTILGSYYEPFGLVGPESILCGTRLVFEREIGCLSAIHNEFVHPFNVWDPASIRNALHQAIELASSQNHRITNPLRALKYDPSALKHAQAVLALALPTSLKA